MTLKKLKLFIFLIWYLLTLLIDSHALDGWKTVKLFKMIMGAHNAHLWNIWWGIIISWDEFRKLEYFPLHSSQLWMGWRLFLLEKIQLELLTFVLLCKITIWWWSQQLEWSFSSCPESLGMFSYWPNYSQITVLLATAALIPNFKPREYC